MAGLQQTVEYLSKSIGPRPAGTEEEQKAAVFISEQLSQVSGLPTETEEFNCNADSDIPAAVCSAIAVVAIIVGMLVSFMAIPCFILALLAAGLYAAEIFDRPIISKILSRGISQNVVAKYQPAVPSNGRPGRQRKVVLVAHYDTGKVQPLLRGPIVTAMPILQWVGFGGIVACALLLLCNMAGLAAAGPFRILGIIAAVCAALPLLNTIIGRISPYTEGANCNGAGVAVLLEVADRVAHGSVSAAQSDYVVHGEAEAQASGYVPEGAELVYDALSTDGDSESSARARLLSAKAAVAAMSGKPVSDTVHIDLAENLVKVEDAPLDEPTAEEMQEARSKTREALTTGADGDAEDEEKAAVAENPIELSAEPVQEEDDVPAWFKAAQKKAKKPITEPAPVHRSRYAQAMEAAQRAREEEERAAAEEARLAAEEAARAEAERQAAEAAARAAELQAQMAAVPVLGNEEVSEVIASASAAPIPDVIQSGARSAESKDLATESVSEIPLEGSTRRFVPVPAIDAPAAAAPAVSAEAVPVPKTRRESFLDSLPSLSMPMPAVSAESDAQAPAAPTPRRRSIDIPSLEGTSTEGAVQNQAFQPAPLAEPRSTSHDRANRLRMTVPSLSGSITAQPAASPQVTAPAQRITVPALGEDPFAPAAEENTTVATAGAFASATGVFEPVGDELLEDVADQEIYVEDADDSDYQDQITETGAFAGPGYVSMPKSRLGRLFGKHRGKDKKREESTPQQWLSVDEEFDARSVGAARGGWESFRQEEEDPYDVLNDETNDDFGYGDDDSSYRDGRGRHWSGGAFSRESLGRVSTRSSEAAGEEGADEGMDVSMAAALADDSAAPQLREEVTSFYNPAVNVEVWFVALGAELAANGGMRAFLDDHAADLRGAIIVDLEGLGAGELTLMEKEGKFIAKKPSSRMDRIVRKAASAVGISVAKGTQCWKDSASAFAMKHGHQAMHLVGQLDGKPAFFAERDDVAENVDEETLYVNSDFVMEVLRKI
ncbi:MAG: aminopeptidase [Eggerthellaceae bacterium]|nr:aminopeptidase [Eggerthellaceae bacterium]